MSLEKEAGRPGEGAGPARPSAARPSGFPSPSPARSSVAELRARDEVLQVMYWMLGENIAHEVDAPYLARFLALEEQGVARALAVLSRERLVLRGGEHGRYRLSEDGIREGGRRFHDEFRDLTKQPHGECAPGCWCHKPEGEGKPCPSLAKAGAARA